MAKEQSVAVSAPDIQTLNFPIVGTAPYVQNRFSTKALMEMEAKMTSETKGTKTKKPRDFESEYHDAMHVSTEGWHGIPAPAFRAAMVDACRLVGFKMTQAKLAVFVMPNGFDKEDATPLVRITEGEPEVHKSFVRIQQTTNIVWRPLWQPGWKANVSVRYDAGMFNDEDITNLLLRVGQQVGLGCGRPNSKQSTGMGWGTFIIGDSLPTEE